MTPTASAPVVLVVATEWFSACGGLSTFNRGLCTGLAATGAKVFCVLPSMSEAEHDHAARHGVRLLAARPMPGGSTRHALVRRPALPPGTTPDLVIGHGRITGGEAQILVEDHFPTAARLHVVHMAADELEWWRANLPDDTGERAEQRTRTEWELSRTATRVVAVGPRLHQLLRRDLSVFAGAPEPLRLDPGFDPADDAVRRPPPGEPLQILLMGRMQDYLIKGVDLAARAIAHALSLRPGDGPEIELLVRGAPPHESTTLRDRIHAWAGDERLRVTVRPFTTDTAHLRYDLMRASLVLMPSRAESFGLTAAEAINAGTPTLVSNRSGLGMLLTEVLPARMAGRTVVPVSLRDHDDAVRWGHHIATVLADPDTAFMQADRVRRSVVSERTWPAAARMLLADCLVHDR